MFTIWKKLFYLLDQNGNGYIDRKEFTNVFVDHLDDMIETPDGRKLLHLLFGLDKNQTDSIAPTQEQITTLFSAMDTNRDNEIEWVEYLRFLQQRQQLTVTSTANDEDPATDIPEVESSQAEHKRELRKKTREDSRTKLSTDAAKSANQDEILPEKMREIEPRDSKAKQEPAPPKRPGKVSSSEAKLLKLQYSNQEQHRLQHQIDSLETVLTIERRRYADLAADRQALMRSYQQLHLKHQNELIQEQTKTKWMKQTIERQQQQLEEREKLRQSRDQASIVLQSTFRSRLEQKRYQGMKLERVNAATAIQCMVRRVEAKKQFRVLQELDREAKQRFRAASKMQRFIRFQLHRKERALLVEAREVSAMVLQKNARRLIACTAWQSQKLAVLILQCWARQRLAVKRFALLCGATLVVKNAVLGWYPRWKYAKIKVGANKIQKWWRRASRERSAYFTLVEAALCIQSVWKRRSARKWFEREWQRQEKYLEHLEAAMCIQAAWRGRQYVLEARALAGNAFVDDDSTIEALVYNLVAMVEVGVDIPAISEDKAADKEVMSPPKGSLVLSDELGFGKEDLVDSAKLGDALFVGDADDIVAVLEYLVITVMHTNEDTGGVGRESGVLLDCDSDLTHVESTKEVETGDQSYPDTELEISKSTGLLGGSVPLNLSDVTGTCSQAVNVIEVQDGAVDDPECSSLSIIQSLIEDMKELVVKSTATEDTQQVSNSTIDKEIVGKAEEIDTKSLEITSELTENVVEQIFNDRKVEEEIPTQDVVPIEASQDAISTAIDQSQQLLTGMFDDDTSAGDFAIPSDGDDQANSQSNSDDGESSIDSTDLMMEADAMTSMQNTLETAVPSSPRHARKATRMNSSDLLADLDQLNAHDPENLDK
ncbi:IQ calmodulin-binding motif-containing protein [Phytophthora infestans]|uniref:IQ calmodulin-binding motif-containing protein n=1 Tax=Phytophthora infestans TaxID=4787 RepID=A0A8S9TMF9_PHYIN|nr:IQ calmodulin-binding motif-containing protein [Phytophthora infestans]